MKQLLILVFSFFTLCGNAQVVFEQLSFHDALKKAETEGKYLMVVFDAIDCDHCNEVADVKLGNQLSQKFIAIRPKMTDTSFERLSNMYEATNGMVTLFFAANGVSITFAPAAQYLTSELLRGAWDVYRMTRSPEYIQTALQWSARAVELTRSAGALDTHARLLYISGRKQEAIEFETEAIATQQKMGFSAKDFEAVLAAMQANKENID